MNGAVRLFVTGGTFDKEYDEIHGTLFFRDSHLEEMLSLGRCRVDVHVTTLMLIDSLDMTDADRSAIAEACERCDGMKRRWKIKRVVIEGVRDYPVTRWLCGACRAELGMIVVWLGDTGIGIADQGDEVAKEGEPSTSTE